MKGVGQRFFKLPAKSKRPLYLITATAAVAALAHQSNPNHATPFLDDLPLPSSIAVGFHAIARSSRALYTIASNVIDYKYSLHGLSPDSDEYRSKMSEVHLRSAKRILKLCEVNKGFYVKAGQFVASLRPVPTEYSSILSSLQDQAVPCHFKAIREVLINNLGKDLPDIFLLFDEQPIAAASIAQVHRALLKDHQEVAIKIFPEYRFTWMVSEFEKTITLELDFVQEAKNSERTARNFKNNRVVTVPRVFWDLTTRQVLTMQFCDGHKVDDLEFLETTGINPVKVAKALMEIFAEMICVYGFLHGDPHPGNILVSPKGRGGFSLVLLDHGIYKELDEGFRLKYCQLWKALILQDSCKIQQLGEQFGVGKYARYFPVIFTGRTIDSKSALGRGMSIEEKRNLKQELNSLNMGDVSSFMESLPPDFLTILRTDGLLRSIVRKLGASSRVRLLAYAKYAVYGLATKSDTDAGSAVDYFLSRFRTRVSYVQLRALVEILEFLSLVEAFRHSLMDTLKRMLFEAVHFFNRGFLKLKP
ncbi:uncharacterized protein LOC131227116 isoform X2 [Magnolia sinica]|uniref:uncharacterized protein LOC131227116 isoform X2 n=1 Tax=Magnolia sinica TaxID=86752 RepID=UPI00265AD8A1|nr:uncharacterized protein LOC131227116 isoform X2 [Magnolia sinica]